MTSLSISVHWMPITFTKANLYFSVYRICDLNIYKGTSYNLFLQISDVTISKSFCQTTNIHLVKQHNIHLTTVTKFSHNILLMIVVPFKNYKCTLLSHVFYYIAYFKRSYLTHRMEYVMKPSCRRRKNLLGEVIRCRWEALPFMKNVSGFQIFSINSQDIVSSSSPGREKLSRLSYHCCRKYTSIV